MFDHTIQRVKLIIDYPGNIFKIGTVFELKDKTGTYLYHRHTDAEPIHIDDDFMFKYSIVFKRIEWFEDRKPCDLPKFVDFGWEGRRKVAVSIEDFKQGFIWLHQDKQYLVHSVPIWDDCA